jgi:hypothetical protein
VGFLLVWYVCVGVVWVFGCGGLGWLGFGGFWWPGALVVERAMGLGQVVITTVRSVSRILVKVCAQGHFVGR